MSISMPGAWRGNGHKALLVRGHERGQKKSPFCPPTQESHCDCLTRIQTLPAPPPAAPVPVCHHRAPVREPRRRHGTPGTAATESCSLARRSLAARVCTASVCVPHLDTATDVRTCVGVWDGTCRSLRPSDPLSGVPLLPPHVGSSLHRCSACRTQLPGRLAAGLRPSIAAAWCVGACCTTTDGGGMQ